VKRTLVIDAEPEPKQPTIMEIIELAAELRHFIAGYQKMRGLDPEYIYSIHRGSKNEAHLRVSRLARVAELLEQACNNNTSRSN
jgi:hypothetical protein